MPTTKRVNPVQYGLKDTQGFLHTLAQIVAAQVPPSEQSFVEKFIQYIYLFPSPGQFKNSNPEKIATALRQIWDFYRIKLGSGIKVQVVSTPPVEGEKEKVTITIVTPNMSFLVDSLLGLLQRLGIKHHRLYHPLFNVSRNKDGGIMSLSSPEVDHDKKHLEALVHCEIMGPLDTDMVNTLKSEVGLMLQEIQLANSDWLDMRQQCLATVNELEKLKGPCQKSMVDFLRWLENGHFTFLGYALYDLDATQTDHLFTRSTSTPALGILKEAQTNNLPGLFKGINVDQKTLDYIFSPSSILINKTSQVSRVHRHVPMDSIGVRRFDKNGNVTGMHVFIGLFTSVAYDSSARDIPMLREKLAAIIHAAGLEPDWHDGKALTHILDSLPRDELFQASVPEIKEIGLAILRLHERSKVALFVRPDTFKRFLSCLVFIPRERFDSQLCDHLGSILQQEFHGEIGVYKAQFGSLPLAHVHYTVTLPQGDQQDYNLKEIEDKLIAASRTWADAFKDLLKAHYSEADAQILYQRYSLAFGRGYQERFFDDEVLLDIQTVETALQGGGLQLRPYGLDGINSRKLKLKLYHLGAPLPLSDSLPLFENLDFRVISEIPFRVTLQDPSQSLWIHDFELESGDENGIDLKTISPLLAAAFLEVYNGRLENDSFNRLISRCGLSWRQALVFRAYAKYARQLQLPFSKDYLAQTLIKNPTITQHFSHYFDARFNPDRGLVTDIDPHVIQASLDKIDNLDEDRILRLFFNLMTSTLRTNFYQTLPMGQLKDYLSFKFNSRLIEELSLPKPMYEIFVYSSKVEAIHLRGGKVARGGIRWSDRQEDFRSEVLGLMKAQMVKNTVIIPVGSKGGFIIKSPAEGLGREEIQQEAIRCYQTLIQGLLDLTDNLIDHQPVPPLDTVCYDEPDPYLVVAADKGTATFSDIANQISIDYNFWLHDAFASGGSAGYDHKKLGVTAKGAWESVKRHFRELGVDIQQQPFTVVGVGDMSGDVFGNGMLLSRQIKLVAAFNHQHIFIDPNPDLEKSYQERQRLFALPRSTWADYSLDALSEGGRIYGRQSKTINMTPEIQALLGLEELSITPSTLIKKLLCSPVDLLWFGGIGTFIKSRQESHFDASDRANDAVRVNAQDLRCKVLAEGANLGITQLGRIEFCRLAKGKMNTDFIDNSAGVACSDREVNIKILFQHLFAHDKNLRVNRDQVLEQMTDEVTSLVIHDNYMQSQALSFMETLGNKKLDQQIQIIRGLEQEGLLVRQLEGLPDDATLEDYQANNISLSRPELAVLLSYGKISFYEKILKTAIADDPYFAKPLLEYFPTLLNTSYPSAINTHPLRREIIATFIANNMLNRSGASFIQEAMDTTGASIEQIVHAYFAIQEVFGLKEVWQSIANLDTRVSATSQLTTLIDVDKILRRALYWMLRNYPMAKTIQGTIDILHIGVKSFLDHTNSVLLKPELSAFSHNVQKYQAFGFPSMLCERLALLNVASLSPDIILIADQTGLTVSQVAGLYFNIGQMYHFNDLRQSLDRPGLTKSFWERLEAMGITEDLYAYQSQMVSNILGYAKESQFDFSKGSLALLESWCRKNIEYLKRFNDMSKDSSKIMALDLAGLAVYTRELRFISRL